MKKLIIFLALVPVGFICRAQNTFKEVVFKEMSEAYKKDVNAFFINRLSEDFRYIDPQGRLLRKTDVARGGTQRTVSATDAQNIVGTLKAINRMLENMLANDLLEPLVFQSGDLAIVSGRHKTTWVGRDGNETTGAVASTFTFQKRKGHWILVAAQQTALTE